MNNDSNTKLLKLLISKVNAMQEQLIGLEMKIDTIQDHAPRNAVGRINMAKLNQLSLPVENVTALNSLEKDLTEDVKRNEIVSLSYHFVSQHIMS